MIYFMSLTSYSICDINELSMKTKETKCNILHLEGGFYDSSTTIK